MGRLFVENKNDYDIKKNFYCKNCKDAHIEVASCYNICQIDCETVKDYCFTLYEITENNVIISDSIKNCEIYPNTTNTFCILDLDPSVPRGYLKEVICKGCMDIIGWYVCYHTVHKFLIGLFFIKKSKVL